jgi:hypothetical protein
VTPESLFLLWGADVDPAVEDVEVRDMPQGRRCNAAMGVSECIGSESVVSLYGCIFGANSRIHLPWEVDGVFAEYLERNYPGRYRHRLKTESPNILHIQLHCARKILMIYLLLHWILGHLPSLHGVNEKRGQEISN